MKQGIRFIVGRLNVYWLILSKASYKSIHTAKQVRVKDLAQEQQWPSVSPGACTQTFQSPSLLSYKLYRLMTSSPVDRPG